MTERNPYSQYNYDNYDQRRDRRIEPEGGTGFLSGLRARISRPVFAGAALLLTLAAFAGIIITSYPGDKGEETVPIIRADAGDIRVAPPEGGGVEVPYSDSTVFSSIRPAELNEAPPVENLAEQEAPVNKVDAFAKEAEAMFDDEKAPSAEVTEQASPAPSDAEEVDVLAAAAETAKTKTVAVTSEKIPPEKVASAAGSSAAIHHPAGSSPDTLAYVKSILDEKDSKTAGGSATPASAVNTQDAITQTAPSRIEPAAGAAAAGSAIKPGEYFVQLSSVTSEAAAPGEWKRLQKAFASSLQGVSYRVQRADLGEKGVRFRIQAGPMARDSAANACNEIKVQKPAGCIVVQ